MPLFVFLCGAHSGVDIEQYSLRREGSEIWATFGRQFESDNGKYEVQGIEWESESDFFELGKKLAEYRAEITVRAMIEAQTP